MGRKRLKLENQRFSRWLVLKEADKNKQGKIMWKCLCDCGTVRNVRMSDLRNGKSKSCGCLKRERAFETHRIDLTGQRFSRLLVLEESGREESGNILWKCRCDCGAIKVVCGVSLRSGHTKSCGCLRREIASSRKGKNHSNYIDGRKCDNRSAYTRHQGVKYYAAKLNAVPSDVNLEKIQLYYTICGYLNKDIPKMWDVDHIIPLSKGGLHHEDNLQILLGALNRKKSNKWPLTEEEEIRYKGITL